MQQASRPLSTLFERPLDDFQLAADGSGGDGLTDAALAALEASAAAPRPPPASAAADEAPPPPTSTSAAGTGTCKTCGALDYSSPEEWRLHFRSDWHRLNLKRRAAGLPAVSEPEFGALVDKEDVGSISGSESGEDSSDDEGERAGAAASRSGGPGKAPHFVFGPAGGPRLAVWRALVAPDRDQLPASAAPPPPSPADCLAALRTLRQRGGRFAVVLLRGGHFAAAVFALAPERVGNAKLGEKERFTLLAHKSAHRYVVRAGQGGKQSAKDASGKYARSAGSRLRRYNEAALQRDVEAALRGFGEALSGCDLLFLHAPGSNAQQLLGGEAPLLDRADPRLRKVPFTTRRPTLSEAQRVMRLLVSVWSLEEQQAAAADAGEEGGQQADQAAGTAAAAAVARAEAERKEAQRAAAASRAAEEAAAQAAAEEGARRRKAEKRARQKAAQQQQRRAAAAAAKEAAPAAQAVPEMAEEDEISAAAARVASASSRLEARPPAVGSGRGQPAGAGGKASGSAAAPRLAMSSKPRPGEDAALRRARMAAAAEQRAKALEAAMKAQQLH